MTNEELFEIWAPADARWSPWARPVLFAQMPREIRLSDELRQASLDTSWLSDTSVGTALVIDVPGARSLEWGLALAQRGYRPVPLFNGADGFGAVVPVQPLLEALTALTPALMRLPLSNDAPPAFLLDADRLRGAGQPGEFDNRWMTFPQDFPSASFLLAHRLQTAILVQPTGGQPRDDLAHVLLRWQEAGVSTIKVSRPSSFRSLWQRALALMGLRRNSAGGFGSVVPQPSSSTGSGARFS